MNRFNSSSVARRRPLRQMLAWSLLVAFGACASVSLAFKALAQTQPAQAAAAASEPAALAAPAPTSAPDLPTPMSNPTPAPAPTMAHSCAACHGTQGQLGDEFFKPLAGMPVQQFVATMTDFREDRRSATLMGHVARGFTDADIQAMGEFFAAQAPLPTAVVQKGAK